MSLIGLIRGHSLEMLGLFCSSSSSSSFSFPLPLLPHLLPLPPLCPPSFLLFFLLFLRFFDLFEKYGGYRSGKLKLKKPKQLQVENLLRPSHFPFGPNHS